MSNKTIIVTGGAGYIGSHVCLQLQAVGYQPVVVDNFCTGNRFVIDRLKLPLYEGDISDPKFINRVFKKYNPTAVMHFAAHTQVGESVCDPSKYYLNNVQATLNLLNCMVTNEIKKIIFSSTAAVYGMPISVPIKEEDSLKPINPYGWSKFMIEQILRDFDEAYEMRAVVFRYFNAAGADHKAGIGELHNPETHLIPLTIKSCLEGKPIKVFGKDYSTPDGTCIRDYVHVSDIARAHIFGLEALMLDSYGGTYNIGNGDGYSVLEVVGAVESVIGKKIKIEYVERRPGDPPKLVASADRIKTELGWAPEFPVLKDIVESAYNWQKSLNAL